MTYGKDNIHRSFELKWRHIDIRSTPIYPSYMAIKSLFFVDHDKVCQHPWSRGYTYMAGQSAHTHGDVSVLERHQQSASASISARDKQYVQV